VVDAPFPANHYDVLGLDPHAGVELVERAYRFQLELYDDGGLATYSLLDASELREARARVQEAYAVLSDPARRHAYDASLGLVRADEPPRAELPRSEPPRGEPPSAEASQLEAPDAAPAPEAPRLPAAPQPLRERLAGPVTGAALRGYRERRGVSLHEIAAASKVGVRFLEYIEQERYSDLPATVYLRGFVQEYARCVGLEPHATAESYLARVPKSI
jgi:curved DNA-binding protein CbpA